MLSTSLVLLSLILSSLMRHHRSLARLGLLLSGYASATAEAFSFKDLRLLVREIDASEEDEGRVGPSSRGADVGAGPREALDDCDESDCRDGKSGCSTGVGGIGRARSSVMVRFDADSRGL